MLDSRLSKLSGYAQARKLCDADLSVHPRSTLALEHRVKTGGLGGGRGSGLGAACATVFELCQYAVSVLDRGGAGADADADADAGYGDSDGACAGAGAGEGEGDGSLTVISLDTTIDTIVTSYCSEMRSSGGVGDTLRQSLASFKGVLNLPAVAKKFAEFSVEGFGSSGG